MSFDDFGTILVSPLQAIERLCKTVLTEEISKKHVTTS